MEGVVKSRSPGKLQTRKELRDLPGGPVVKTLPFNAGGVGSTPGQGAKIQHALWPKKQNTEQKQCCHRFNKDFKNGPHPQKYL